MDHIESDFEETYPYNSMYEGEKRSRKKRVSYKEPDEEEDFGRKVLVLLKSSRRRCRRRGR